jgi:CelD/BcsL family acetyltransferase involved in cellulose biosynthesis
MIYGFVWQHDFAYYQGGWEPEWASRSLGTVLVAEGIALAGREGLRVWDFLRGAGDYKYRFGAQDRVDQTWLIGRGLSGRILDVRFGLKARLAGAQHRQEVAGSRSAQEDAG